MRGPWYRGWSGVILAAAGICAISGNQLVRWWHWSTLPQPAALRASDGMPVAGSTLAAPLGVEPGTGRNLAALLLTGVQISLCIAVFSVLLACLMGVLLALTFAVLPTQVRDAGQWVLQLTMSLPWFVLIIAASAGLRSRLAPAGMAGTPSTVTLLVVLFAVMGAPYAAQVLMAQIVQVRSLPFYQAAVLSGASRRTLMMRELLPQLRRPLAVYAVAMVPSVISGEAALSFLGVGLDADQPSWGYLINEGMTYATSYPLYMLAPAGLLVLLLLALTTVADDLQQQPGMQLRRWS